MPKNLHDLREEVEAARFLREFALELAQTHPFLTFLVVFLALTTLIGSFRTLWSTFSVDFKKRPRQVLGVLAFLVIIAGAIVVALATRPTASLSPSLPAADTDIIGQSVTVTWRLSRRLGADDAVNDPVRYLVEFRSDGVVHRTQTYAQYHAFEPRQGTFYWRVRAEQANNDHWSALSDWSPWRKNDFYRSALERIRSTKLVRVGVSSDYLKPFIFHNESTNDLDGIDIRVVHTLTAMLAKNLGLGSLSISYKPNTWLEGNANDLKRGLTDFAIGETSIETSREQQHQIRFTRPYWYEKMALVSLKERPIRDVHTAKLTAWLGTTYEQVARLLTSNYDPSATIPEMLNKLTSGAVDGFIDGSDIATRCVSAEARSQLNIRPLEVDDLPSDFIKATVYPIPDGLYVAEREGGLLSELNRAIGQAEFAQVLRDISATFANK